MSERVMRTEKPDFDISDDAESIFFKTPETPETPETSKTQVHGGTTANLDRPFNQEIDELPIVDLYVQQVQDHKRRAVMEDLRSRMMFP